MGNKLTIHNKRNTQENYWFKSFQYDKNIIDDITDPSGGNIDRLLTAVPSPFARMHLFETAFTLALKNMNNNSLSVFDKMVSECFDLFELLFNYQLHKQAGANLSIKFWDFSTHLNNLLMSTTEEHKFLSEVFSKYYKSNERLAKFNVVYMFFLDNEVFGGTSPFTGCFTRPDLKKFKVKKVNGKSYFDETVYLWDRDEEFLKAMYKLFSTQNNGLINSAHNVYKYLDKALGFIRNDSLRFYLTNSLNNIRNDNEISFTEIKDENNAPITICGASIPTKNAQDENRIESPLELDSPHLPDYCRGKHPLVLRAFKNYRDESKADLKIPTKAGDIKKLTNRLLPDNNRMYPYLVVDDFLEDHLIKLNYPVNYSYFLVPNYDGNIHKDEDNGFLLPIKKEFFDFFDIEDLKDYLTLIKKSEGFSVELNIPVKGGNPVTFRKYYYADPRGADSGKIITANVYFGFFPLFKVKDNPEYNDFFKIMMVDDENTHSNVSLKIFDESNIEIDDNTNAEKYYKVFVRNKKTPENNGSYYYETNFPFKYLEINLSSGRIQQNLIKGLLVPTWKEIDLGNRKFDVAVDFGTTNTHVVLLENRGNEITMPQALSIGEIDQQTILFNRAKNDPNKSLTEKYESGHSQLLTSIINRQIREFVPSIIGEGTNPAYKFPMRTAISTAQNYSSGDSNLLSNINISFSFEKYEGSSDEKIQPNLKWEISEGDNEVKVKEFIKELLILVRNKILLNQGNPKFCRIVWFKPLSMYEGHQQYFKRIWDDNLNIVFKLEPQNEQSHCLTESCAPYFYYTAQNKAQSTKPVLSIDIGGGSTDVSFFQDNEPQFGTSFNFAGNAIWNPGMITRREGSEGMLKKYSGIFDDKVGKNFNSSERDQFDRVIKIFNSHKPQNSADLFNLYFAWDHIIHITDDLRRDPYIKFLILFHFSSIIYHCVELLRYKKYAKPEYICVSGRGSKYLSILDPSRDLNLINGFLTSFVNDIFNSTNSYSVKLERVDLEKEATSIGGLYLLADSKKSGKPKDTPSSEPYLGEINPQFNAITYKQIDSPLKDSVNSNVIRFLNIFFDQNNKYNFSKNLVINLDKSLEEYKKDLENNSLNYLELGLSKRLKNVKLSDQVNEPLFFYPIITMIYELSKNFYNEQSK